MLALASTPLANRDHRAAFRAHPIVAAAPAHGQAAVQPSIEPAVVEAVSLDAAPVAPVPPPSETPPPPPAPAPAPPDVIIVAALAPEPVLLAPALAGASGLPLLGQRTTAAAPGDSSPLAVVDNVVTSVLGTPLLDKPVLGLLGGR